MAFFLGSGRTGRAAVLAACATLSGCAGRVEGVFVPSAQSVPGASSVDMLVATTRKRTDKVGELYSGERGEQISFGNIVVSIPPDEVRKTGEVQWPAKIPANPATEFATLRADQLTLEQAIGWFRKRVARTPQRRVLVFIHGFNNRVDDAVFRFAQIIHDAQANVAPILFTWPSRGSILAYGYDRESTNYSRNSLERLLQALADSPHVGEVSVLAHSMGNWVTLEALRQMAIRKGRVAPKIKNVMLAAPDVDVDVFRTQIDDMGSKRPDFTLFVSQDDRALAFSRRVWGSVSRLGAIDPAQEPFKSQLERSRITVVDLTKTESADRLKHGKFAESPEVVRLIGARLASGQKVNDSRIGIGDRIIHATTGVASTIGSTAGMIVTAPLAIVDANTRNNYGRQLEGLQHSVTDSQKSGVEILREE